MATPTSTLCSGLSSSLNETKVRELLRMLVSPADAEVQRLWWATGHAPLERLERPYDLNCNRDANGCDPADPALVRCSNESGGNRRAVPRHTGAWPICNPLLERLLLGGGGAGAANIGVRPLAYSFGIAREWHFDDAMADLGFEVHSFDPTIREQKRHASHRHAHTHFHYQGIHSNLGCRSSGARSGGVYGGLGGSMLTLAQIREQLQHTDRPVRILKLDCEGCEWDVFYQMSREHQHALDSVSMLLIEVHQVRTLQMKDVADLRKFQEFFEFIFERQGFRFFFHHRNYGGPPDIDVHPRLLALGAQPDTCCFEIGLVKPHHLLTPLVAPRRAHEGLEPVHQLKDCSELVSDPVNSSPYRSPQALHTAVARHLHGKSVVEIGTRDGDGMRCFAQLARKATAVEADPRYCAKLKQQSARLAQKTGATFSVACKRFQVSPLDADVITWWAEEPHLNNSDVLRTLRSLQAQGRVRPTAEAIFAFDSSWPNDRCDWDAFRADLQYRTIQSVEFDEAAACKAAVSARWRKHLCARARGTFHLMTIPVANVPLDWNLHFNKGFCSTLKASQSSTGPSHATRPSTLGQQLSLAPPEPMAPVHTGLCKRLIRWSEQQVHAVAKCLRDPPSAEGVTFVTTTSNRDLKAAKQRSFNGTPLRGLQFPIWLYHEASRANPAMGMDEVMAAIATQDKVCLVDLMKAVPVITELTHSPDSCIDAFYRIAGRREPFERAGIRFKSGKLLVRKVAAIYHATSFSPQGHCIVWVDMDVTYRRPIDDGFLRFVQRFDVVAVPNQVHAPVGLNHSRWFTETGILAFTTGDNSQRLLRQVLDHYDGGAVDLASACLCHPLQSSSSSRSLPCDKSWLTSHLYLDDLWVWTLFLHWQAAQDLPVKGLRQGWFASKPYKPCPGFPATRCACTSRCARPNATSETSPFEIARYLLHHMGQGALSLIIEAAHSKHSSTQKREMDPDIIFPETAAASEPPLLGPRIQDAFKPKGATMSASATQRDAQTELACQHLERQ